MTRQAKHRWSWHHQATFLNSTLTLARWRWRQQWFLLLVTGLGITLAIALIGSLPLFSNVMSTAGLRNVLRAQSNSAQIVATVGLPGFSSQLFQQASEQVDEAIKQDAGGYFPGKPQVSIQFPAWSFPVPDPNSMSFYGVPLSTANAHIHLLQGRLPVKDASHLEILLTPTAARDLQLKVGDTFTLQPTFWSSLSYLATDVKVFSPQVTIQLVGIF